MTTIPLRLYRLLSLSLLMLVSGGLVFVSAQSLPPRPINIEPPSMKCTVPAPNSSMEGGEVHTRKQQKEQWLQLANAAYADTPQRLSEAEAFYKSVIQVDGRESRAYVGLANVFAGTQRYDEAIEKYQEAIKINPKSFAAHYGLGNVYSAQKQYDKAIHQFKKTIDLNPRLVEAHYNLGTIYYLQKNIDGVLKEVEILMKLDEALAQRLKSLITEEARK